MAIAAQLYQDGREAERYRVEFDATLRDPASAPLDVVVEDLSSGGFRVITGITLSLGDPVGLGLAGIGARQARVVWCGEGSYGCEFATPLSHNELRTALSAPSSDPVSLLDAAYMDPAPAIEREQEAPRRSGLTPRGRFFAIVATTIVSWIAVIALAWAGFKIVATLLRR